MELADPRAGSAAGGGGREAARPGGGVATRRRGLRGRGARDRDAAPLRLARRLAGESPRHGPDGLRYGEALGTLARRVTERHRGEGLQTRVAAGRRLQGRPAHRHLERAGARRPPGHEGRAVGGPAQRPRRVARVACRDGEGHLAVGAPGRAGGRALQLHLRPARRPLPLPPPPPRHAEARRLRRPSPAHAAWRPHCPVSKASKASTASTASTNEGDAAAAELVRNGLLRGPLGLRRGGPRGRCLPRVPALLRTERHGGRGALADRGGGGAHDGPARLPLEQQPHAPARGRGRRHRALQSLGALLSGGPLLRRAPDRALLLPAPPPRRAGRHPPRQLPPPPPPRTPRCLQVLP